MTLTCRIHVLGCLILKTGETSEVSPESWGEPGATLLLTTSSLGKDVGEDLTFRLELEGCHMGREGGSCGSWVCPLQQKGQRATFMGNMWALQ